MTPGSKPPRNAGSWSADQDLTSPKPLVARKEGLPIGPSPASHEDRVFVNRLLAGDEVAFTEMVGRYHERLLRLALTFVSDRAAAEGVVQDTWLGVLQGLPAFEGRFPLKTWIFRILINRAKSRGVREGRSLPFSSMAGPEAAPELAVDPGRFTTAGVWRTPPEPWAEESPEKLLLRAGVQPIIEEAIDGLPLQQRLVLTLRDVEGLKPDDICNVLEITETNQRVLLHRARSKIRRALESHPGRSC